MQIAEEWLKTWICLSFIFVWARAARPRFDVSTDMGMVLVPADAEVDSAIFRLRATDQDADFPLIFEIIATTSPIVRVENLPCTLYNKVCQANVILTRRLVAGRLHDFVVRVRDSKGDVNSMQATISVTNATTPRDKIFPHLPSLIMVPEDTKPEKELDYLLVESNPWSGKPVYIELWQPKELFKIRQRQMGSRTKGVITLIGDLDFETQSMYTLTMYATDPYTEPGKDTRNIAGVHVVVIVQDVQDVPPVFTLAPPLTKINNTVKPGDVILRVHAEDGDKGVPREVTYGLISEGNPFTPFFNVSETTGEITLARPLEELTQITHVGAPIVLKIVAEEIRSSRDEPPAQASVVELGLLLGEPGNSPPYFDNDNYVAWIDENAEPGTVIVFTDTYSTTVRDEDIGKAGVFSLTLENNNGTFEVSPAVAERVANFIVIVRDSSLIDYEKFRSLRFKIRAQEVGPATNLSATVPVTIFLRDVNDNPPVFDMPIYEVTLSENPSAGTRVLQVHATDADSGVFGKIQYTKIIGDGSDAFEINPDTGAITISMGSTLDREQSSRLELTVEAKDEEGRGLRGSATLIVNILDVNDNPPIFERGTYEFLLNAELTNFTMSAIVKAHDADAEPPNNVIRYEIIHGNYDNKFQLDEESGQLTLREAINTSKPRKSRQTDGNIFPLNLRKQYRKSNIETLDDEPANTTETSANSNITTESSFRDFHLINNLTDIELDAQNQSRRRRAEDTPLFILTVRAYDLGVPHLSNLAQIRIMRPMSELARIVTFVMPGENPDPTKTAETLATITGSRVVIQEIKPYVAQIEPGITSDIGKRSVVVARVEQSLPGTGTVVDVDKIREILAANGFGIISGMDNVGSDNVARPSIDTTPNNLDNGRSRTRNASIVALTNEEVVVYKTENKLLTWLLILLGLLLLAALITLIACCICPSCPFYMEPRKRRIHSSETLVVRADGRPKRHLHRKPIKIIDGYHNGRKEAWSADPERQQWQFNRRNTKNPGIASLPGDIAPSHVHHRQHPTSLRGAGDGVYAAGGNMPKANDDERIYMEDMETQQQQRHNYEQAEMDSLRRHELERGSDAAMRESHFYRDGNAEVMRLVTRGDIEDHKNFNHTNNIYHVNGKDILMQRFIEDQKLRRNQDIRDSYHENYHDGELDRSMESHRRANEPAEILILPERLEMQQQPSYALRQHQQEQMSFKEAVEGNNRGAVPRVTLREAEQLLMAETSRSGENTSRNPAYSIHDAELVRQNALLTRLLLEKEAGHLNVPVVDSSSFLETQSLPGHVAIATQTDRTTSTQTEFFARSRSDNEESEEDPRTRRKSSKLKGRLETKEDFKKMKTIWVRTPIEEESRAQSGTKIEVTESRKVSISPEVLKEISNSLDEDDEKVQKPQEQHKPMSKTAASTSKKKMPSEASRMADDDDSTTPSPESKDKMKMTMLAKSKLRKKPEKPPRAKKPEAEKSHFMEPSFRVLEREISSIHHKIRQFGDKKLSLRKKEDGSKKESEDDSGATYDVSKKFEVTVKRTKKSVSRETSPTKISVEQRSKPSEDDTYKKDTSTSKQQQQQQMTSSSDLDDFNNSNSKTIQYEVSKLQTRSRSELRRQARLEHSSSDNNKNGKSDESDKFKFSSSSPEDKIDPNNTPASKDSGNGNEQKTTADSEKLKRASEKKSKALPSQKAIKRSVVRQQNGTIEPRKKVPPVKSKTEEDKRMSRRDQHLMDKAKSLTASGTKSMSSSSSKSKEESVQYDKLEEPEAAASPAREMVSIDLDKLAQDVRGVVEKEISSLTQAAREALINKTDKKDEKATVLSPSKSRRGQSVTDGNNKSQSSSQEKQRMSKSLEGKKELVKQQQKSKTKSVDSASPTEVKSDDAISFIVIENNKTALSAADHSKKYEERDQVSRKLEKSKAVSVSDDEKRKAEGRSISSDASVADKSKETLEKVDAPESAVIPDSKRNSVTDAIDEIKRSVGEIEKSASEKIEDVVATMDDNICETEKMIAVEIREAERLVSEKIDETKKNLSSEIDESKKSLTDEIDETKKSLTDEIDETKKSLTDEIDETKKAVSNKIDETKRSLSGEINETKKSISDKLDETKKSLVDEIDETKKMLSDKVEKSEMIVVKADKLEESKLEESKDAVVDKFDEGDKVDPNNKIDETTKAAVALIELDEAKKLAADKIEEGKEELQKLDNLLEKKKNEFVKSDDVNVSPSKEGEIVFTYAVDTSNDLVKAGNEDQKESAKEEPKQSNLRSDALKFMSKCLPRKMRDSASEEIVDASKERETTIESETTAESTRYRQQIREAESITIIRSTSRDAEKTEEDSTMESKDSSEAQRQAVLSQEESQPDQTDNSDGKEERISDANKAIFPEKPSFEITNAIRDDEEQYQHASGDDDDDDDDESSSASDISNRTALQATLPYGTPRHSISSDGGGGEDTAGAQSEEKTRQKWSSSGGAILKVEESSAPPKSLAFPRKIEVEPIDRGASDGFEEDLQKPFAEEDSRAKASSEKYAEPTESKPKAKPVVVSMKRKEHLKTDHYSTHSQHRETHKSSPRREKIEEHNTSTRTSEQRKVETRSKHTLKVSHRHSSSRSKSPSTRHSKEPSPMRELLKEDGATTTTGTLSPRIIDYGRDPEIANARSRYMAWYQQKRAEMERKRRERKEAEEEMLRKGVPKKSGRKAKAAGDKQDKQEDEAKGSKERAEACQSTLTATAAAGARGGPRISRLRIRPLVNVESEQLKAIVRQGRKLRKAEGTNSTAEDPPVQIFVPEKPPKDPLASVIHLEPRHHLTQHSEYKYEKVLPPPIPFFLHAPPPPPHPSPENFQDELSESRRLDDDLDSGIAVSMQGGTRLRHQQLLEKKSVFDIAYNEAAPTQLRSDSSTPPS